MKTFILFLIAVFLFATTSFAEEKAGFIKTIWQRILNIVKKPLQKESTEPRTQLVPSEVEGSPRPEGSPLAELSEEELRERIRYMLEITPEIADFIPELKEIKLEALDKETLIKIHSRVANERSRIQTERIQRQLEATRAAAQVQNQPQVVVPPTVPRTPTPPPTPPKVHTPPSPQPTPPRR